MPGNNPLEITLESEFDDCKAFLLDPEGRPLCPCAAPAETVAAQSVKVKITAGGHTLYADFADNSSVRALLEQMPLTLPMMNLYGREMCFRMGNGALPAEEAKNSGYEIGDISYWPPAGSLVILYEQNGEVFQQQPIGHIDGDVSFFVGMGTTDITFEKAN